MITYIQKIAVVFSLFCISVSLLAQERETTYRLESFGSVSSGDNTPFWMLSNTWGMVPLKSNNIYLRTGIFHDQKIDRNWSFSLGFDVATGSSQVYNTIWVQQIYGAFNWKTLRLRIGSQEDYSSLLDERLSSGDLNASSNARPAPEIKISSPDFIPIPDTEDMVYIKGDFAIGKYLDGDYQQGIALTPEHKNKFTKNVLSHHKSLFFRIGSIERKTKWELIFGIDNHAQWGGDVYVGGNRFRMASSLKDFIRVFFAQEGGSGSLFADKLNIAGNQSGTYLAKFNYKLKDSQTIGLYWQHFFDDKSGLMLENCPDMLLGIVYKSKEKKWLSGASLEYLNTRYQSGPVHFNITMSPPFSHLQNNGYGMDNYYNNTDYVQGLSYYGRTYGNPLFLSPEYDNDGNVYFNSNRIFAMHAAIEGYLHENMEYLLRMTYGESLGRYDFPYLDPHRGFASALHLTYHYPKVSGLDFGLYLGINEGKYFGQSTAGVGLNIMKRGIIPD